MKSIAKNTCLWAAALTVVAAAVLTVGPEFGPAGAKPNPPCGKSSDCAGAGGTGGTNAKGSRVVTTVAGTTTTTGVHIGATVPVGAVCAEGAGCGLEGPGIVSAGTTITASVICDFNCIFTIGSPPTTITREGSANGGRTVSQVGSSAPSTVTGHH
jgi:hypothetical protein